MDDLKILGVTARGVNVPLQYPVRTSVGLVDTAPLVLIDLRTNAGVVGRSYLFTYSRLALPGTLETVRTLGAVIGGQRLAPAAVDRLLSEKLRLLGRTGIVLMACAGLDMAVWDALAQHAQMPLAQFLGGSVDPVPAYDSHSMDGVELGVNRAVAAVEAGFGAIKTKIGYPSIKQDVEVVRALRAAVGPDIRLFVDYNQALSAAEAVKRIQTLESEGVDWVEEPIPQEDLEGCAAVRRKAHIPIQMGENWCGPAEMERAITARACDLAMPDVMKIGGVTGWLKAAAIAEVHGIPMSSHIFPEFSAHLLAVTKTAHLLESMNLAGPILAEEMSYRDGCAVPKDVPGVGLVWNEEAVARYLA